MASTPVQKELGKIASDFRRYRILRSLAFCWGILAVIASALLLLYWTTDIVFPYAVPILLGIGFVTAIVVFIRGGRTSVALREIARQVENDDPKLNTLLLAAAEQEPDAKTGELNFLQLRVISEALEANRKSPWSQRFNERLFWAQSGHLATLVVCSIVLLGLVLAVPPVRNLASIQRGSGLEITPGNVSVEKGNSLAIVAKFRGRAPADVHLVFKTPSGAEQRLPMARSLNDPLFGVTIPNLQEDTTYRIEYSGKASDKFVASIFEFPDLKRADANLKFPEYTAKAPEKIEDTRRVTAVEGTDVKYDFFLNKPVRSARLIGTNDTEIVLTNSTQNAVAYATAFPLLESGSYKLQLVDNEGRTNKVAPDFVFVALPNQRPKLKFETPRGDQRVSAIQEVRFNAKAEDDFGLADYGLTYTLADGKTESFSLASTTNSAIRGMISKPNEAQTLAWMLAMEKFQTEPGQLVSYYLWADDLGPDGKARRSESDMFFAEVRPFEEIFRQANSDSSSQQQQQQQQGGGGQASELLELQKEIITATWNVRRRENAAKVSPNYKKDVAVVKESQQEAIEKAEEMAGEIQDDKMVKLVTTAMTSMKSALDQLESAESKNALTPLPEALKFEQSAYQALLKLQAREYQVSRSQSQSQSASSRQQRNQQQLDQLELKEEENRYETQSQASPMQDQEQREALQVLNRLKELARRQQDMSERIKELQSALNEAKTKEEKENLERMLKRLQEEQQQIVQDTDELRQRMQQPENQSRMAEARQQLDQTRQQSREAAEQLENRELSQALSSSSRAQQQLQQLSDKFREQTSKQFADEMRQLRQEARDLEKKHNEIAEKLDQVEQPARRSLSEEGPAAEALAQLAQERSALTNLLSQVRKVTEQSENAEPLLHRQLYDALRKTSQTAPEREKNFDMTQQALERNFYPEARRFHDRVEPTITELKQSVERAAESVLGNEADSLRFAENELRDLAERVQRELEQGMNAASGSSTNGTNNARAFAGGRGNTNSLSQFLDTNSTNRSGRASRQSSQSTEQQQSGEGSEQSQRGNGSTQQGQQQENSPSQQSNQRNRGESQSQQQSGQPSDQQGQQPGGRSEQNAQEQSGQQGQEGQQGQQGQRGEPGQQQGQTGEQGQQGQQGQQRQGQSQQQSEQQSQQQGQGQGQGRGQGQPRDGQNQNQQGEPTEGQDSQSALAQNNSPQQGQYPGQNPGQAPTGGRAQSGQQNLMDQLRPGRDAARSGPGGGIEGPMTGREFTQWSDRLRDVEEVLQTPRLRLDVARVREQARLWRAEQKRHANEPNWNLLEESVINPLRIVQNRVAEELARLGPREAVVPVDRDPVPQKYSDLVSRYYERLGSE